MTRWRDAIEQVRTSELGAGTLTTVYVLDSDGGLCGSVFVVTLLRSAQDSTLEELAEREPVSVGTDADLPEVARMMTDYNLVMLPVLDAQEHMVGVVTVDDVLELTLPIGLAAAFWRRARLMPPRPLARLSLDEHPHEARRKEAGMDREQPRSTQSAARLSGPSLLP